MRGRPIIDITGNVYNGIEVLSLSSDKTNRGTHLWNCRCFCGNLFQSISSDLRNGRRVSCGCARKTSVSIANTKHGQYQHRLYKIWCGMISRSENKNVPNYSNYGGRGIKVCDRWSDVNNFIEDMDADFTEGLTLDRIDVNLGYEKSNCRWADLSVQSHNRRPYKNTSSYFKGVHFSKAREKWIACIMKDGQRFYLGGFCEEIEAAIAYDNESEIIYGDRPNKTERPS